MAAAVAGLGAALLLTAGCTGPQYRFSGFFEDYSKLKPSPVDKGTLSYRNPNVDFTQYEKIFVQPVAVHFADPRQAHAVRPGRLETYKGWVRDGLRAALAKYNLDAPQPGENIAELRFQVANVRLTRKIDSPDTVFKMQRYQTGSANVEAALVDGRTGTVLGATVGDTVPPEWIEAWSEQDAWESLEASTYQEVEHWVSTWAPRFVDAARPDKTPSGQGGAE
jgi:hypothetical protein